LRYNPSIMVAFLYQTLTHLTSLANTS